MLSWWGFKAIAWVEKFRKLLAAQVLLPLLWLLQLRLEDVGILDSSLRRSQKKSMKGVRKQELRDCDSGKTLDHSSPGWWFGCHEFYFCIYWVANHPSWRNHIFQRGGPTTNQSLYSLFLQQIPQRTSKIISPKPLDALDGRWSEVMDLTKRPDIVLGLQDGLEQWDDGFGGWRSKPESWATGVTQGISRNLGLSR